MSVSGASDQVMVRGTPKHVVAYLKDFLFDERQARAPVKALSGGENYIGVNGSGANNGSAAVTGATSTAASPKATPQAPGRKAR